MDLPNPWIALGVVASTAATDAVYVMFNGAVRAASDRSRELEQRLVCSRRVRLSAAREIRSVRCLPRVARGWERSVPTWLNRGGPPLPW